MNTVTNTAANNDKKFVIVDTGCANLSSVKFAVERLGYAVTITDNLAQIKAADKVILPGVGNAKHAMKNIREKQLVETIQNLKQPVLGFCLGMQLMARTSVEGVTAEEAKAECSSNHFIKCLELIPTDVTPLESKGERLPHMGWNTLTQVSDHPIFSGINVDDYFYFVHSFAAPVSEYTIASCEYGSTFSAAIARDNFIGCQFHPERSGPLGAKIIKNFLEM